MRQGYQPAQTDVDEGLNPPSGGSSIDPPVHPEIYRSIERFRTDAITGHVILHFNGGVLLKCEELRVVPVKHCKRCKQPITQNDRWKIRNSVLLCYNCQ